LKIEFYEFETKIAMAAAADDLLTNGNPKKAKMDENCSSAKNIPKSDIPTKSNILIIKKKRNVLDADVSNGSSLYPIPLVNDIDDERLHTDFIYREHIVYKKKDKQMVQQYKVYENFCA
jgi:hypothetical protein